MKWRNVIYLSLFFDFNIYLLKFCWMCGKRCAPSEALLTPSLLSPNWRINAQFTFSPLNITTLQVISLASIVDWEWCCCSCSSRCLLAKFRENFHFDIKHSASFNSFKWLMKNNCDGWWVLIIGFLEIIPPICLLAPISTTNISSWQPWLFSRAS